MVDRAEALAVVREMLTSRWPGRFPAQQIADHVSLGAEGLGLDSIEIVELLLDCEDRFGTAGDAEELLEAGPVTVGRLIDQVAGG